MKTLKFVTFSVIILASISAALIYYAFSHVDEHIIEVIEKAGSDVTQSTVEVDRAVVNLQYGIGSLYNLSLNNPATYSDRVMYVSNNIAFKVDMSTLSAPVIVINTVDINDMYFYIETAADSLSEEGAVNLGETTNLQAMIDAVSNDIDIANISRSVSNHSDEATEPSIKIMIERINFSDAVVEWQARNDDNKERTEDTSGDSIKGSTLRTLTAPGFFIENLGDKTTGLSVEAAASAILQPLLVSIQNAVEQQPVVKGRVESGPVQDRLGEQLLQAITSPKQSD